MKIPAGEYAVIPSSFENYRVVNFLLNLGFQGYRLISDTSLSDLFKGDFLFPLLKDQTPEHSRVFHALSLTYSLKSIRDDADAPQGVFLKHMKIGIYCGKGVTSGYLWHFYPMEKSLVDVVFLKESDIGTIQNIDVICFPSGGRYRDTISSSDQDFIKNRIHGQGMGFLGTCGGSVFGVQLSLLDAKLTYQDRGDPFGVPVSGYPPMAVEKSSHPAMVTASAVIRPFYYWGQVFQQVGPGSKILANYMNKEDLFSFDGSLYDGDEWKHMAGKPGVISGKFGRGHVILSGVHPEVGEEQLFMDWIFYLAAGRDGNGGDFHETSEAAISSTDQHLLVSFLSEIDEFSSLLAPYAAQFVPYWKDRWHHHNTIGLSPLMILSDISDRVRHLQKTAGNLRHRVPSCALPMDQWIVHRIHIARLVFSSLTDSLTRILNMLKKKERLSRSIQKKMSTQRNFYPEEYFDLTEALKSVNMPLIEIDYALSKSAMDPIISGIGWNSST